MKKLLAGYSLIEIMVVMTLFALLILVATQTLLLSLRGTAKSESISEVKENLEFAVTTMERQIRNAKSITPCPNTNPLVLNYETVGGVSSSFSCVNPGVDGYIASGSAKMTNNEISITECTITCTFQAGIPESVSIRVVAQDKSTLPGAERARAESSTTVLLRQY